MRSSMHDARGEIIDPAVRRGVAVPTHRKPRGDKEH